MSQLTPTVRQAAVRAALFALMEEADAKRPTSDSQHYGWSADAIAARVVTEHRGLPLGLRARRALLASVTNRLVALHRDGEVDRGSRPVVPGGKVYLWRLTTKGRAAAAREVAS